MNIADLKGEQTRVDIEGMVIEKGDTRSVNLRAGGTSSVADATIRDETGSIKLTLWGDQINSIDVGDKIAVDGGYTKAFRGELQMNVGRYGALRKINPAD